MDRITGFWSVFGAHLPRISGEPNIDLVARVSPPALSMSRFFDVIRPGNRVGSGWGHPRDRVQRQAQLAFLYGASNRNLNRFTAAQCERTVEEFCPEACAITLPIMTRKNQLERQEHRFRFLVTQSFPSPRLSSRGSSKGAPCNRRNGFLI